MNQMANGAKAGSGGVASFQQRDRQRRERLQDLLSDIIDAKEDPYLFKNHLGKYECKLCGSRFNNEAIYLIHAQGKMHQNNLAKRAHILAKKNGSTTNTINNIVEMDRQLLKPKVVKNRIGQPAYRFVKQKDPETNQYSILFQLDYPEIEDDMVPRYRFMSSFEQKIEPPNENIQYLLFGADPYNTIAFKIPNKGIDQEDGKLFYHWDEDKKQFTLQIYFL